MVALLFRNSAGAVYERKRLFKIGKPERPVQMMFVYNFPVRDFSLQGLQHIAFKRSNAAAAWNARLVRKCHHLSF